jgi:hypothetical protein
MNPAEQTHHALWQLSDARDRWRDPMAPFRDLCAAQADALRGDPDGIWSPEFGPF